MLARKTVLVVLAASAWLAVNPAAAQSVNCNNVGETLQAAIDALYPSGTGVIDVQGTCAEAVVIEGFRDLTIMSTAGATIAPPVGYVGITVDVGSKVKLCGLTIDGGRTGLVVAGSQVENVGTCTAKGLVVRNSAGDGIAVLENGAFQSRNGVPLAVTGNAGSGILVTAGSRLNLQGVGTTASVHDNGDNGVFVGEGSSALLYYASVTGNGGSGVLGVMGSVVHLGHSVASGNANWGVLLTNNVTGQLSGGAPDATTVSGNGAGGVLVTQRSALRIRDGATISGNTGSELTCTVGGDAYGDASGLANAKKDCPSFKTVTTPGG